MSFVAYKSKIGVNNKKKPPPRPPPPNFSKYKSKSTLNLNQQIENLIEWSPPNSPTVERTHTFGGSVSSSFSSSTSSLASSKKSFEYDLPVTNNLWPVNFSNYNQVNNSKFYTTTTTNNYSSHQAAYSVKQNNVTCSNQSNQLKQNDVPKINIPSIFGPTIIRAQLPKNKITNDSKQNDRSPPSPVLPMPSIPPPSPPKGEVDVEVPYGIALFDYEGTEPSDLSFQANDVIILVRRINNEWLYGRVLDREGMFPANFVDIQVPLTTDDKIVMALYEFNPQMSEDLALKPGQFIKVTKKINSDWLYGESNGKYGQFPSNFVDRIPEF